MPSFAIEAEGETVPLSVQDIFQTLAKTAGPQATQQSLQVSAKQLSNWERTPGYYSLLQDVYSDFTLDEGIRLQAIIQLKNGIDKHWRKTSQHAIQKAEKQKIRSQAIEVGVQETKRPLALQNALMLAKIFRFEFPHDWPDAISILIHHLRNAAASGTNDEYVRNILSIILQVIKELASGRLIRTKKSLESVAPELLHVLGQLYVSLVQKWAPSASLDENAMYNSHACLKTLRRLLVFGFEHPHREMSVKELWQIVQEHTEVFFALWQRHKDVSLLPKHLFQVNKLWLEMARQHPASFVLLGCMNILNKSWSVISGNNAKEALSSGLDWSVHSNGDSLDEQPPIEKMALKALLLFRACIKMVFNPVHTFKYQYPEDKEDRKAATEQVKAQVFTNDFVVQLMEILVTQYFVLRPTDLRDWEQEPDEWERREEEIADAWEFSIRSCSEKLFLDLVINFKDLLVPRLLQVFEQYGNINNHEILLKDSLYSAIGIAAACVEDVLDFNAFIRNTLVPEIQLDIDNYNLLRRRTAIVLGQWVPIQPEKLDRIRVYQIFAHLLEPSKLNDHVVRVTAGRQLRPVLEPFEFSFSDFEPYATSILENLMRLIQETELTETKMALLETVRVVVTKLEEQIEPYARGIMGILPTLWAESGEEHLMKQAILTMITAIINSLGQKGKPFHEPIYPLVNDSVQPDSEASVYLLEEALELWSALLMQTPSQDPSPQLLAMSKSLLPLLDLGSEHLRQCFEILESYIVLSPTKILDPATLTPLLTTQKTMLSMLNSSKARDASSSPHVLQLLVQTFFAPGYFDAQTRDAAFQHFMRTMLQTGYLSSLLSVLHEAYSYHQDPRPNRKPPDIIGIGETSLFTLLSYVILVDPSAFLECLRSVKLDHISEPEVLPWLLAEWFHQFDSVPDSIRRKVQILALSSLLSINPPPETLLSSLQSLFAIYTDILSEISDGAAEENRGDNLFSPAPVGEMLPSWPGSDSPEDVRKRHITNWDVVYTINAPEYVAEKLRHVIKAYGGQEAFEQRWITDRVDADVIKGFADLGIL